MFALSTALSARRALVALAATAGIVALSACGGSHSETGAFRTGPARGCLVHQTAAPGSAYRGGVSGDTASALTFLRYYTAHSHAPFCDGSAATSLDRTWARLYVDLTGNPARVRTMLGG
jgi:hypothetical protein